MNAVEKKSDYLLLIRGTDWDHGLSPEEIQKVMNKMMSWFDGLHQQGILKAGQPLGLEGAVISGKKGRTVADGPYAESKEAVGGYLILNVADMDAAMRLAREFPCLEFGVTVEVRPIAEECPTFRRVRAQLEPATA